MLFTYLDPQQGSINTSCAPLVSCGAALSSARRLPNECTHGDTGYLNGKKVEGEPGRDEVRIDMQGMQSLQGDSEVCCDY